MAKTKDMVASGLHTSQAGAISGGVETGITATAAGTISTSYALTQTVSVVATAAAGSGVRLLDDMAIGDTVQVKNLGANAVNVFPPTSASVINALSAGAALSVAAAGNAFITKVSATNFISA